MEELDKLIENIPIELRDCFYIKIGYILANKMISQAQKNKYGNVIFPCMYKGIHLVRAKMEGTELDVIPNKECYFKVSSYEINKTKKFLDEYEKLCRKHNLSISACGCCNSPYLYDEIYTIVIDNIFYKDGKVNYDMRYTFQAMKYLQESEGESK